MAGVLTYLDSGQVTGKSFAAGMGILEFQFSSKIGDHRSVATPKLRSIEISTHHRKLGILRVNQNFSYPEILEISSCWEYFRY